MSHDGCSGMGFLGIDESNHGKYPEIYAGVYSNHQKDIRKGSFDKERSKKKMTIMSKIRENGAQRDYRHCIIPVEYTRLFTREQLGLIAITELIQYFDKEYGLDQILIDGEQHDPSDKSRIKELVHPGCQRIRFIPNGDREYRIINLADYAAYRLFRQYTSKTPDKELEERFSHTLVTPRLEEYVQFFNEDKKIY
jgi:hypothetical protein